MAQRKFVASWRVPEPSPSRGKDVACLSALGGYPSKEQFHCPPLQAISKSFPNLVRPKLRKTTQVCVRKGVETALGWLSLNLIVAGELIRLSSAFAIRLGASGDLGLGIGAATNV